MKLPPYNKLKNKKFSGSLLLIGGVVVLLLLMIVLYFFIASGNTSEEQNKHFVGGEATFTNQKRDSVQRHLYYGQKGGKKVDEQSLRPMPPEKIFGRKRVEKLKQQLKESGNYHHYSAEDTRRRTAERTGEANQKSDKEEAYRKAKSSDIFVGDQQTGRSRSAASATSQPNNRLTGQGKALGQPKASNSRSPVGLREMPSAEKIKAGYNSPLITGRNRFGRQRGQQYQRAGKNFSHAEGIQRTVTFHYPQTPYTIQEGTLIPATLLTSINSDLPGDIIAIVNRNIYDSNRQKYLLIPKGTKLIGSYDNQVVISQNKLLMSWHRMIFPEGRSIKLSNLNSYDLQGKSGLSGKVNNHFWDIFGKSALLSVIGAGVSIATRSGPQRGGFYGRRQSVGQIIARQIATSFNRVASRVLSRGMNRPPTIHIKKGKNFNIFVAGDISFPQPYQYDEYKGNR